MNLTARRLRIGRSNPGQCAGLGEMQIPAPGFFDGRIMRRTRDVQRTIIRPSQSSASSPRLRNIRFARRSTATWHDHAGVRVVRHRRGLASNLQGKSGGPLTPLAGRSFINHGGMGERSWLQKRGSASDPIKVVPVKFV